MSDSASPVLALHAVVRTYHGPAEDVRVLDGVDLELGRGETIAVMGASGSGKSTLLHLAAGMDLPDSGTIELLGQPINRLPEPERTRFRARNIGLVFQDYNLIDSMTAAENVELVAWLTGQPIDHKEIARVAEELGIGELLDRRPDQLSGGQQQRVAIARALIHRPALVLADEPTGSLDHVSAERVQEVLAESVRTRDCTLVLVTHSESAASVCARKVSIEDGHLVEH